MRYTGQITIGLIALFVVGIVTGVPAFAADLGPDSVYTNSTSSVAAAISAGGNHTCALTNAGGVHCWGYSQGTGSETDTLTPGVISGLDSGVTSVTAGGRHSCAITGAGGLQCWGRNTRGQLGNGTTTESLSPVDVTGLGTGVASVSSWGDSVCAVTTEGSAKCWGLGTEGQLGYGSSYENPVPIDVPTLATPVADIANGAFHSCALTTTGGVQCWGYNSDGQLGNGTTSNSLSPVDVVGLSSGVAAITAGERGTCALTTEEGIKCWGKNDKGQLGNGTTTSSSSPVDVQGLTSGVAAVSMGGSHACALTTAGAVKCWGFNFQGYLGDGTTTDSSTPADVAGLSAGIAAVSAGHHHTCAMATGGSIVCWGGNNSGELGDGTTVDRHSPVSVVGFGGSPPAPLKAPVVSAGADQVVALGTAALVSATFTDDDGGTHTARINWGDGSPLATATVDQAGGVATASYDYASAGVYTATVTVTDDDGESGSDSLVVTVANVAPAVDVGSDVSITEGSLLSLEFSFVDAASGTHDATVAWGDGNTAVATVNQSLDTATATHAYADEGVFVVQASVTDDTGLSGLDTLTVTVTNAVPVVTPTAGLFVGDLLPFTVTLATFTDDGASDTHVAMIDWGDGTVEAAEVDQDAGTISGTHHFIGLGLHTLSLTVMDNDGGSTTEVLNVQVFNAPPVPGVTSAGMLLLGAVLMAFVVYHRRRSAIPLAPH